MEPRVPKAFISSVINGFEAERAAARAAVESLDMEPVMAERFGAQSESPQEACLKSVRESDVYIGILGPRYGYVTAAGISVTEEEFLEARDRGLPIFWFAKNCPLDPDQAEFRKRIGNYEEGHLFHRFSSEAELTAAITKALYRLAHTDAAVEVSESEAAARVESVVSDLAPPNRDCSLCLVAFSNLGSQCLDLVELAKVENREKLLQPALFGTTALFDVEEGPKITEASSYVRIAGSRPDRESSTELRFYEDGALACRASLEARNRDWTNLVARNVIDETAVAERIERFVRYTTAFHSSGLGVSNARNMYVAAAFANIEHKLFGRIEGTRSNSMSWPTQSVPDPLIIPQQPLSLSRAELNDSNSVAGRLVAHAARAFRVADRYFDPAAHR